MDVDEIRAFFKRHRIRHEDVFDARGMSRSDYRLAMEQQGKLFALNADICDLNHRIRNRSGHCIVCDTSDIHHYLLWYRTAFVYVAGSLSSCTLKIGTSNNLQDRVRRLNGERYGGANDWVLLTQAFSKESGRKEKEAQKLLRAHFVSGEYLKNVKKTATYELVRCNFDLAKNALGEVLEDGETSTDVAARHLLIKYSFS
jgi:hypothetical protein